MMVGPKPKRRLFHHTTPVSSGCAFTTTPCLCRSCESWFVSANDGISVEKCTEEVEVPAGFVDFLKSPWIAVPVERMEATFPLRTSRRKKGLYGTRIRVTSVARCAAQ